MEKGGLSHQSNKCMLLGMEQVRTMMVSDWDDNCHVALYPRESYGCTTGDPIWKMTKQEVADRGNLVDNNWTCFTNLNIDGGPVYYAAYLCE